MANKVVHNCTPHRLRIVGADSELVLSPLERAKLLSEDEIARFDLRKKELERLIEVNDPPVDDRISIVAGAFFPVLVAYGIIGAMVADSMPAYWLLAAFVVVLGFLIAFGVAARGSGGVYRALMQFMSFLLANLTAWGFPAAIIYFFGGGHRLLESGRGLLELGRLLQLVFIGTAAILPGLLYYLFDRQQLTTLRDRFEQQIFRFDPTMQTLADVAARYGRQLEEVYGRDAMERQNRLGRGKRWPILLATVVFTMGWLLTLGPVHTEPPNVATPGDLLGLFAPTASPIVFGFLGAYFFGLQTILRRFVRRDLKPGAYASVSVRVFVSVILAWVLMEWNVMDEVASTLAFMVGIFPETGIVLIQELLRKNPLVGRMFSGSYAEKQPLTELEGIGIYDRARLEDEGVTNVQSLAYHDLIDLMIETRIPIARLVDWVDQAILYLHIRRAGDPSPWAIRLGRLGIRNATDLLRFWDAFDGWGDPERAAAILSGDSDRAPDAAIADQLHVLVDGIRDDEWVDNLVHWRRRHEIEELTLDARPRPVPAVQPTEAEPLPVG